MLSQSGSKLNVDIEEKAPKERAKEKAILSQTNYIIKNILTLRRRKKSCSKKFNGSLENYNMVSKKKEERSRSLKNPSHGFKAKQKQNLENI